MTDVKQIAHRYIELWNERAPKPPPRDAGSQLDRRCQIRRPADVGDGHDGVDALISGVQQKFPDFKFTLIGEPNGFGEHVRFSWGLGPDGTDSPIKGTDFAVLSQDGRIKSITGFLDQVPQGA